MAEWELEKEAEQRKRAVVAVQAALRGRRARWLLRKMGSLWRRCAVVARFRSFIAGWCGLCGGSIRKGALVAADDLTTGRVHLECYRAAFEDAEPEEECVAFMAEETAAAAQRAASAKEEEEERAKVERRIAKEARDAEAARTRELEKRMQEMEHRWKTMGMMMHRMEKIEREKRIVEHYDWIMEVVREGVVQETQRRRERAVMRGSARCAPAPGDPRAVS